MNLMLLASVAVILLCALIGYRRGLIKSAVSAVGIVGAVILTNVLNPYVNQFLCQHTPLRDTVRQKVEQSIGVEDISESVSVYEKEDYLEHTELPEIVKNYIRSNGGDKINGKATDMVMNGLSYLLTIFVVLLLVLIALALSHVLSGIPVVGGLDKAGGLAFGIAQAVLCIWIAMVLITFLSAFSVASQMLEMVHDSKALTYLYDKNIFLKIVIDILGDI